AVRISQLFRSCGGAQVRAGTPAFDRSVFFARVRVARGGRLRVDGLVVELVDLGEYAAAERGVLAVRFFGERVHEGVHVRKRVVQGDREARARLVTRNGGEHAGRDVIAAIAERMDQLDGLLQWTALHEEDRGHRVVRQGDAQVPGQVHDADQALLE